MGIDRHGGTFNMGVTSYPDGMPIITGPPAIPIRILARPKTLGAFAAIMFWVDALAERGHAVPELVLPFIPGARQDRLNPAGDYLFTAKSVAAMLNARHFPRVTVLDPHSDVAAGMIDRCDVIQPADILKLLKQGCRYQGVISPDAGAEKRAGAVARKAKIPLRHAGKTRDVRTGAISGFWLEPVASGQHFLVVDDICDGGGTFIGLAAEIAKAGCTAELYVTHGLYSKGTDELRACYALGLFSTDSIIRSEDHDSRIPVCEQLLMGTFIK